MVRLSMRKLTFLGLLAAALFGTTLQPIDTRPQLAKTLALGSGKGRKRPKGNGKCLVPWRAWYVARSRPAGTYLGGGYFVRFDGSLGNAAKGFERLKRRTA
jgi:hypothetical protein